MQMICILTMLCSHWYIHIWLTLFGKHINTDRGNSSSLYHSDNSIWPLCMSISSFNVRIYIFFSKGTTNVYVFFKLKDICGDYLIL